VLKEKHVSQQVLVYAAALLVPAAAKPARAKAVVRVKA
jgi:hypothetical protein